MKEYDNSAELKAFDSFLNIIKQLRDPDGGCPWDLKQTAATLRTDLVEEAYEVVEAVNKNDTEHICEELGDLLLVDMLIAYIKQQSGDFTISAVLETVSAKLVRRHPHVFADAKAEDPDQVVQQWDEIKEKVEGRRKKDSILDSVKEHLPLLTQADKIQKKASRVGFDWQNVLDIFQKLEEEKEELNEAIYSQDFQEIENEVGDLLFTVVNIARYMKVDPNLALHKTLLKFRKRFRYLEQQMAEHGIPLAKGSQEHMERFWTEAKSL